MASKTKITFSAIWLRLPEFSIEFYDIQLVQRLGNKIGKILTVDTCTSTTTRGRYARLCVEVLLDQPLKTHLFIGSHKQTILYEGLNKLCIKCGRLEHNQTKCSYITLTQPTTTTLPITQSTNDEWKIVHFPMKSPLKSTTTVDVASSSSQLPGEQVKPKKCY